MAADGLRPEMIALTDEQQRHVAREVRRRRLRCGGCGSRRFHIGAALHLGFLFVSEEHGVYLVALSCRNPRCPAPRSGIRLRLADFRIEPPPESPLELEPLPATLRGRTLLDHADQSVGKLLDVKRGRAGALWGVVATSRLWSKPRYVPLQAASMDGEHVVVPVDGATIRHSPALGMDGFSSDAEEKLLEHYHLGPVTGTARSKRSTSGWTSSSSASSRS